MSRLIGDILQQSALRFPGRTAIIDGDQCASYAQFNARVNQFAHALLDLNLNKADKIAILSTSRFEYALAYFAIARCGQVSVHISTRATEEDMAFMLNKVHAKALLFEAKFAPKVTAVLAKPGHLQTLVAWGNNGSATDLPKACRSLEAFLHGYPENQPKVAIGQSDPVAITFTGGTTGFPKAVLVSHQARCATALASAIDFGLTEQDIVIVATPLFHAAGLFVWFTTAIMHGASIVLQRSWDPRRFVELVQGEAVSAAFLVPSQLHDVITQTDFAPRRLASLKKIGYAGAPIGSALSERIRNALPGVQFTENYGQSEACPITVRCPWHPTDKRGTVGRAASNVELRVVDQHGNPRPTGEMGEVIVRAEQVFDGYFDDSQQTAAAFRNGDGWLWTGDLGYLDTDGFLTLVDRSKDMLVTGGENVYPAEIENALYCHEAVAECAVFGIPDSHLGEVTAAHVVATRGASISEAELIEFCARKVARFKAPRLIKFVSELPHTPVGKIRKNLLREPYWAGHKTVI